MKKTTITTILVLFWSISNLAAKEQPGPPPSSPFVANQLIISFLPGTTSSDILALQEELEAVELDQSPLSSTRLWQLPDKGPEVSPTWILEAVGETNGKAVVDNYDLNYKVDSNPTTIIEISPPADLSQYTPLGTCESYPGSLRSEAGEQDINIAIIDSGIDHNGHPNLFSAFITDHYNYLTNNTDAVDDHGHGTSVAGVVTASFIAAGYNKGNILNYKILNDQGVGDLFNAIKAIEDAAMKDAHIVNISWGYTPHPDDTGTPVLMQKMQDLSENVLFIVSSGNLAQDIDTYDYYPAGFLEVDNQVTVGSSTCDGKLSPFSNYSAVRVALLAPGEDIFCPDLNGGWTLKSGTSFAAPVTTTLAALMASDAANWDPEQISCLLRYSVTEDPVLKSLTRYGGVLDADPSSQATSCGSGNHSNISAQIPDFSPITDDRSLQAFPNPFREQLRIRWQDIDLDRFLLRVYNNQGQVIHESLRELIPGGSSPAITLNTDYWPAGNYWLQISTTRYSETMKLVHMK